MRILFVSCLLPYPTVPHGGGTDLFHLIQALGHRSQPPRRVRDERMKVELAGLRIAQPWQRFGHISLSIACCRSISFAGH